jgi:hypothetical protein
MLDSIYITMICGRRCPGFRREILVEASLVLALLAALCG